GLFAGEEKTLEDLMRIFNKEIIKNATGDVFGRIYEYFLANFSIQKAHDNGEFFTPASLVQTIVNVIEPNHGFILDPACGSGGMFVQSSHFMDASGDTTARKVTFYGQEKNPTTIRIAKMNLAVHGLDGKIAEAITYYQDEFELVNKCDFVMANPPFNVDLVDSARASEDRRRLPFGLPGINKGGKVSNGNYLWISYFYSYLNEKGRAGFVMSSQASSAGHDEKEVRRRIIETGDVDAMISIRPNFFYTRSVPCELWFFNRAKPKEYKDKVLMLDARNIYRKVTRKVFDFSPEQMNNIAAIIWLYRGVTDKYLKLIEQYFGNVCDECGLIPKELATFEETFIALQDITIKFQKSVKANKEVDSEKKTEYNEAIKELADTFAAYDVDRTKLLTNIEHFQRKTCSKIPADNKTQSKAREIFDPYSESIKGIIKQIDMLFKLVSRCIDIAEKELDAKDSEDYDTRLVMRTKKELDAQRKTAVEQLKLARYFYKQIQWLQERFPDAKLRDVQGLVKLADLEEIEANDWSLTPGRYVGVAAQEESEEDGEFEEKLRDIHVELASLNEEAAELAKVIAGNFEELSL
ncbi:MAG TPA: N-6 DNA methylase, partial [Chitinispirillaceae bacterium]|nr:N-6 DNA methylase [Chitinispirillaceae bacterium]